MKEQTISEEGAVIPNNADSKSYDKIKQLESKLHTLVEKYKEAEMAYMEVLDTNVSQYMNQLIKIVKKNKKEEYYKINQFGYKRKFNVEYENIHKTCKPDKFKLIDLTTPEGEKEYSKFEKITNTSDFIQEGIPMLTEPCDLENKNIKNKDMNLFGIVTKDGFLRKYPNNPSVVTQIEHSCPKNEAIELPKHDIFSLMQGPELSVENNCEHLKINKGEKTLQNIRNEIEKVTKELNTSIEFLHKKNKTAISKVEYIRLKENIQKDLAQVKDMKSKKDTLLINQDKNQGSKELAELYVLFNWENIIKWTAISVFTFVVLVSIYKYLNI